MRGYAFILSNRPTLGLRAATRPLRRVGSATQTPGIGETWPESPNGRDSYGPLASTESDEWGLSGIGVWFRGFKGLESLDFDQLGSDLGFCGSQPDILAAQGM